VGNDNADNNKVNWLRVISLFLFMCGCIVLYFYYANADQNKIIEGKVDYVAFVRLEKAQEKKNDGFDCKFDKVIDEIKETRKEMQKTKILKEKKTNEIPTTKKTSKRLRRVKVKVKKIVPEVEPEVVLEVPKVPEVPEVPEVEPEKKKITVVRRASRKPSKYNLYVKKMMATDQIRSLPARQRMTEIGILWKKQKEN